MKMKTMLGAVVALCGVSAFGQTATLGYWKLDGADGDPVGTLQSEVNPLGMEGFGAIQGGAALPTFVPDTPGRQIFDGLFGTLLNGNNLGSVRCVDPDPTDAGQHGGYLTFTNGTIVSTGNGTGVKPFTFEMFLKMEAFEDRWTDLFGITRPSGCIIAGAQVAQGSTNTQIRLDLQNAGEGNGGNGFNIGKFPGYNRFPDGDWHHVALLYDGDTNLFFYVDYVNYGGAQVVTNKLVYDTSNGFQPSLRLGYTATAKTFSGCFDEFRVTEGMLTADQFLRAITLREDLQILFPFTSGEVGQTIPTVSNAYDPAQGFFSGYAVTPPQVAPEVPAGTIYLQDGKGFKQRVCQSALFAGAQMKVFGNNFLLSSAFTAETFFKIRTAQDGAMLFGTGDDRWQITLQDGKLCLMLEGMPYPAAAPVDDAAWHHLALVGDGQQVSLYLDYDAVLQVNAPFPLTDDWIYVGDAAFDGWLYGVRFTGSALPVQDFLVTSVADDYNTLAHWRFDDDDCGARATVIRSADSNPQYQGIGSALNVGQGDILTYTPFFTNTVPGSIIWEPGPRKIRTAQNKTSLRFTNANPDNPSSPNGGVLLFQNVPAVFPPKLTIETFARFDAPIFFPTLIEKQGANTTWQLDLADNLRPRVRIDTPTQNNFNRSSNKNVNDGEWHHIALQIEEVGTGSYDILFYVDYEPAGVYSGVTDFGALDYSKLPIRMGAGTGRALDGWLDEPRISGSILGVDQFLRVFTPEAAPRGYWLLDGQTWSNDYAPGVAYATAEPRAFQATQEKNDAALAPQPSAMELSPAMAFVYDAGSRRALKSALAFSSASTGVNAISGSQVIIPFASVVGATNFTAEVFFKVRAATAGATIMAQPGAWSVETDADGRLLAHIGKQSIATGSPLPGGWHHVALVTEDSSASLYLDYGLVGSSGSVVQGTEDIVLGAGVGRAFDGWMHSFRYMDEALLPSAFLATGPVDATIILLR